MGVYSLRNGNYPGNGYCAHRTGILFVPGAGGGGLPSLGWLTETTELFEMGIGYMQRKILRWKRLFAGVEFHSPGGARKWVLFAFLWLVSGKK